MISPSMHLMTLELTDRVTQAPFNISLESLQNIMAVITSAEQLIVVNGEMLPSVIEMKIPNKSYGYKILMSDNLTDDLYQMYVDGSLYERSVNVSPFRDPSPLMFGPNIKLDTVQVVVIEEYDDYVTDPLFVADIKHQGLILCGAYFAGVKFSNKMEQEQADLYHVEEYPSNEEEYYDDEYGGDFTLDQRDTKILNLWKEYIASGEWHDMAPILDLPIVDVEESDDGLVVKESSFVKVLKKLKIW